jgi:hypothetical protein
MMNLLRKFCDAPAALVKASPMTSHFIAAQRLHSGKAASPAAQPHHQQ